MGLQIAVGVKAVSSRPIALPEPLPADADDGIPLDPVVLDWAPRVGIGVSQDQMLLATCSLCYYDMIRHDNGERETTIAEVRVQVSLLSQAFSSAHRDILYRIPLPDSRTDGGETSDYIPLSSVVVFASDQRHLACLIPHPRSEQSVVCIFQLRQPRIVPTQRPPRPSYLGPVPGTPTLPVATNPRIAQLPNDMPFLKASALCNVDTSSGSILLAGGVDGSIVVIPYRTAQVAGILYQPTMEKPVSVLSHQAFHDDDNREDDGASGKLVVIERNGTAVLFSSRLVISRTADVLLMQLQRLYEFEGSFVRAEWMGPVFVALLLQPGLSSVSCTSAQVWAVPDDDRPAEPISSLIMTPERLKECAHGSFSLENAGEVDSDENGSLWEPVEGKVALHYDEHSGCLAVSSLVLTAQAEAATRLPALPFACIWNWRNNVVGLTVEARPKQTLMQGRIGVLWRQSLQSGIYFSKDLTGGRVLVHVLRDGRNHSGSRNRIRKEVYTLAHLSPSEVLHGTGSIQQPSSLMVSATCVTFPCVASQFSDGDTEFTWKESRIPSSYTSEFGAPRLSSIGRKQCRSIAIASSRGLCVLDCSRMAPSSVSQSRRHISMNYNDHESSKSQKEGGTSLRIDQPKWRMFGSENAERAFRVLAMTWWEGEVDFGLDDAMSDDILVAVLEVYSAPEQADGGKRYLAGWSRRWLNQSGQLMLSTLDNQALRTPPPWGVPLPDGLGCVTISLVSDPSCSAESSSTSQSKRKAMVLLSGVDESGCHAGNFNYELYQLQVLQADQPQETKFVVGARVCASGNWVMPKTSTMSCVSGVFLASASFDFNVVKKDCSPSQSYLATVGIIKSPGEGLDAIVISSSGVLASKGVVTGSRYTGESLLMSEVSSFWHSHTSFGGPSLPSTNSGGGVSGCLFVWSLQLCDGSLLCWSVPFATESHPTPLDDNSANNIEETEHTANVAHLNGIGHSAEPADDASENKYQEWLLGIVTEIGDSSCWMYEASSANRTGLSLGCLPTTPFGCALRCSQSSRHLRRIASREAATAESILTLDEEIFCLGSTNLTPPTCVPALFSAFRGEVKRIGANTSNDRSTFGIDFSSITENAFKTLMSTDNQDTIVVALKLLIVRSVEMIAKASGGKASDASRRHALFLSKTILADVIDTAILHLSPMQFASVFLGIGRQIEPSYLAHLFPLPSDRALPDERWQNCRSVEDLFLSSIRHGSVSTPSSALPLFSSKRYARKMCASLLSHCLITFDTNAGSPKTTSFDMSIEERRMLRGIFRFGLKMEDSGTIPHLHGLDDRDPLRVTCETNGSGSSSHLHDYASDVDDETMALTSRPRNSSRICQLFFPSIFFGKYAMPKEEEEIYEAASSFILSGFGDLSANESAVVANGEPSVGNRGIDSFHGEHTMGGVLSSYILSLAFSYDQYRWHRIAALAQCLLGGNGVDSRLNNTAATFREYMSLANTLSVEDLFVSLQSTKQLVAADKESDELVHLLKRHLADCGSDISCMQALAVLHVVQTLLSRRHFGDDMNLYVPGLLVLGIIVGHWTGYATELLDTNDRNVLIDIYAAAFNEMERSNLTS